MPGTSVNPLLRYIRSLVTREQAEGQSDEGLLNQFVSHREETAFAALTASWGDGHGHLLAHLARQASGGGCFPGDLSAAGSQGGRDPSTRLRGQAGSMALPFARPGGSRRRAVACNSRMYSNMPRVVEIR